jgi:AcrR family transcriptional regulator
MSEAGVAAETGMPKAPSLRERKKAQTRESMRAAALRLFLANGYERTTVEEIAAAANVSPMTFFRYFPSKEDVVMEDFQDDLIEACIAAQPAHLSPLVRVQNGVRQSLSVAFPMVREALLVRLQLALATPALRARLWEHLHATEQLIARALSVGGNPDTEGVDLRSRVVAAACVAALSTAFLVWAEEDGVRDLPALLDETLTLLRAELA